MAWPKGWPLVFCFLTAEIAEGFPFQETSSSDVEISDPISNEYNFWIFLVVLSIGSLISLVTILLVCGAGECCGHSLPKIYWFGRSRQQTPMSFDNPVTELGGLGSSIPLSQIDVRALELDPVVFEPLPTIHDLFPLSSEQAHSSSEDGKYNGGRRYPPVSYKSQNILISAFANEDSELYAHDWFDEPHRNFQRNSLEFVREVGKGWFGEVLEADAKDIVPFAKNIRVLVKRLNQHATQLDQMRFLHENRIYRDANQGNVLKLLGSSIEKLPFLLIMEHFPQGDLKGYLISNVTRSQSISAQGLLLNMALDFAKGLEWMINNNFRHPDLACRNCYVASEGRIVIGDMGLSTQLYKDDYYWNSNGVGWVPIPIRWAAPETIHCTASTIQTLKVTEYSNIFSFGVVLGEVLAFSKLPYYNLTDEEVITQVFAGAESTPYSLNAPSLPYIPFKEELFQIMKSCWEIQPTRRPPISSIVTQLQELSNNLHSDIKKKDIEFDLKWERLGRNSLSSSKDTDTKPRGGSKKSVSFTGIENMKLEIESVPTNIFSEVDLSITTTAADVSVPNAQLRENIEQVEGDNEKWLQEMEDGGVTQKVMNKTRSVQDFMVLTHVEPSDIHGPESLMEIPVLNSTSSENMRLSSNDTSLSSREFNTNESSATSPEPSDIADIHGPESLMVMRCLNSSSVNTQRSSNDSSHISAQPTTNENSGTSTSVLAHSSSSLSQGQISGSLFVIPDSTLYSSQFENINCNDEQNIPPPSRSSHQSNVPEVAVKLSTPGAASNFDSKLIQPHPTRLDNIVRPSDVPSTTTLSAPHESRPRRRTSTPKRSASSSPIPPSLADDFDDSTTVFGTDCSLSPIRLKPAAKSGILPGGLVTTGPLETAELAIFQGVTSRISFSGSEQSSETDDDAETQHTPVKDANLTESYNGREREHLVGFNTAAVGHDIRELANDGWKIDPLSSLSGTGAAKVVFKVGPESTTTDRLGTLLETDNQSTSWDIVNGSSSWDVVSMLDIGNCAPDSGNSSRLNENGRAGNAEPESTTMESDEKDIHTFWNHQMKSLSNAAQDTKSLLALSLETDAIPISPSVATAPPDKFVEDINLVSQDLGSLILDDLENESGSLKSVVAESRHNEANYVELDVKLAFTGGSSESTTTNDNYTPSSHTIVEPWNEGAATANQIEESQDQNTQIVYPTSYKDFVPSTWNHSLIPARPAIKIKSPCATEGLVLQDEQKSTATGLIKKSVSFERSQIVHEYSPPPPSTANDIEASLRAIRSNSKAPTIPLHSSLDWEITPEDMELAQNVNESDPDDEVGQVKSQDPMGMYRISGFEFEDSFKVSASCQPFGSSDARTLGQLRHTRDKLTLNLTKDEPDSDRVGKNVKFPMNPQVLDSGVGESPAGTGDNDYNRQKLSSNSTSSS